MVRSLVCHLRVLGYHSNMLIGILSDTHDTIEPYSTALKQLRDRGAEYYIHCGDVGSEHILDLLAGLQATFIWGNNDWDSPSREQYATDLGLNFGGRFASLQLDGKQFAVIHGDDEVLKRKLLAEQKHDYLLQGHTHLYQDTKSGKTRIINPGALYRARTKSVALLDTTTDTLQRIIVG